MEDFASRIQMVSIQFVPFILAVVFHEWGHGMMARSWGDKTAEDQGRLTLNPVPHIDPLGTILFPLINMFTGIPFLIGWARPVPINPNRFRKFRPGLFWTSVAGPGANCLLALLSAFAVCVFALWTPSTFYLYEPLIHMGVISIQINFALAIFNLLPVPPLDGSKVIESFLNYNAMKKYEQFGMYGVMIVWALLLTGMLNVLQIPIMWLSQGTLGLMGRLVGVPT